MLDSLKQTYRRETDFAPLDYEIRAEPSAQFCLNRRELLTVLGAGLLVTMRPLDAQGPAESIATRLMLREDGGVRLLTGKIEMGQGSRTLMAQAVAEELAVDPKQVLVIMGDTALCPDDGGSWASLMSITTIPLVRRASAACREWLIRTAAERWNAAPSDIAVRGGRIHGPGGRQAGFADFASSGPITGEAKMRPPSDWRVLGTDVRAVQGRDIVTGTLKYASDLKEPGMLWGKVIRSQAQNAALIEAAPAPAGVHLIRDGDFLGIVGPDEHTVTRAARDVKATWKEEPLTPASELAAHFRKTAQPPPKSPPGARYPALIEHGDWKAAIESAPRRHESEYFTSNISHVAMEPRSAIAWWQDSQVTVRTGTQAIFLVRKQMAAALKIAEAKVRVIASDSGGGFGSKHMAEMEIEAARLARAAGKPVKLSWTREEEFTRAYVRPAALVTVRSGFDASGKLLGWEFRNYNAGAAGLRPPYNFVAAVSAYHPAKPVLKQGPYRSLAAAANTFARECHVDEVAKLCGRDPVEHRLANLASPRSREALERAAEKFGWGKHKGAAGVAANVEKDGYLALFAAIEGEGTKLRVTRIVVAADFGAAENPGNLRNQITGAILQGLGGALFERTEYDATQITTNRLSRYRVPRFSDAPEIEVILIDRRDIEPAGAGEAPITVVAPAIANAIFAATGDRRRQLPLLG